VGAIPSLRHTAPFRERPQPLEQPGVDLLLHLRPYEPLAELDAPHVPYRAPVPDPPEPLLDPASRKIALLEVPGARLVQPLRPAGEQVFPLDLERVRRRRGDAATHVLERLEERVPVLPQPRRLELGEAVRLARADPREQRRRSRLFDPRRRPLLQKMQVAEISHRILQSLEATHQLGRSRDLVHEGLEQVADPLAPDPGAMRLRSVLDGVDGVQRLVERAGEGREDAVERGGEGAHGPGSVGVGRRPEAGQAAEPAPEPLLEPAEVRVYRGTGRLVPRPHIRLEVGDQAIGHVARPAVELCALRRQPVSSHFRVPPGPRRARQVAERSLVPAADRVAEHRSIRPQGGAKPADRDPEVVQRLGVGARAGLPGCEAIARRRSRREVAERDPAHRLRRGALERRRTSAHARPPSARRWDGARCHRRTAAPGSIRCGNSRRQAPPFLNDTKSAAGPASSQLVQAPR
jgi:hypothetical protein